MGNTRRKINRKSKKNKSKRRSVKKKSGGIKTRRRRVVRGGLGQTSRTSRLVRVVDADSAVVKNADLGPTEQVVERDVEDFEVHTYQGYPNHRFVKGVGDPLEGMDNDTPNIQKKLHDFYGFYNYDKSLDQQEKFKKKDTVDYLYTWDIDNDDENLSDMNSDSSESGVTEYSNCEVTSVENSDKDKKIKDRVTIKCQHTQRHATQTLSPEKKWIVFPEQLRKCEPKKYVISEQFPSILFEAYKETMKILKGKIPPEVSNNQAIYTYTSLGFDGMVNKFQKKDKVDYLQFNINNNNTYTYTLYTYCTILESYANNLVKIFSPCFNNGPVITDKDNIRRARIETEVLLSTPSWLTGPIAIFEQKIAKLEKDIAKLEKKGSTKLGLIRTRKARSITARNKLIEIFNKIKMVQVKTDRRSSACPSSRRATSATSSRATSATSSQRQARSIPQRNQSERLQRLSNKKTNSTV